MPDKKLIIDKDTIIDIEVFKSGKHIDSNGNENEWTESDLDTIVNTYNEAIEKDPNLIAPAVKGHPKDNDPAYGWVQKLYRLGDKIKAKIKIVSSFAEEIKEEAYKKVSLSLYENLMLRHIGFLGAVPPAIKGLENVTLDHSEEPKYIYDFNDLNQEPTSNITVEQLKLQQKERELKYGIGVKDKIGYIEKPNGYKDIEDDSFADPVNYLYPINDFHNLIASREAYSPWDNGYNNIEKQIIQTRFIKAEESFGIDLKKKYEGRYSFSENNNFIELKETLKRDKPEIYKDYLTEDFGDSTHYRFPIKTEKEVRASIALFHNKIISSNYTEEEKTVIISKLLSAATKLKININPETWSFTDLKIPIEQLNKKQLEDYINNNISINHNQGIGMNEYLQKMIESLIAFLNESATPELATQVNAWIDDYKTANPLPTETPTSDNNEPQIPKEFAEKIAKLEKENREMKFNEYITSQIKEGKLVPAQSNIVLSLLELGHSKGAIDFAENGKSVQKPAIELVKELINTMPKQIEFGETPDPKPTDKTFDYAEGFTVDENSNELHTKVINYMEEQKTKFNNIVEYKTALFHIANGGK